MPLLTTRSSLLVIFCIAQVLFAILSLSTAEAAAATAAAAHSFGPIEVPGVASAAAFGLSVSASALGLHQRRRGSDSSASSPQESPAKRSLKSAEGGARGTCAQCKEQLKELQEWFAGVEASKLDDQGSEGQQVGGRGGRGLKQASWAIKAARGSRWEGGSAVVSPFLLAPALLPWPAKPHLHSFPPFLPLPGVEASKLGDAGSEGQPGGGGGRGRGGGGRGGAGGRGTEADDVMALQSRLVEKQGELKRLKAEYEALQKRHEKVNADKAALDVRLTESGADWGKKAITKEALTRATELLHSCKPQTGPVISKKVPSWKGYSCSATERELQRYMDFETRGMCPDDWLFVQDLIFRKQCHSLPKRRCLARTAHKIVEPLSRPASLFAQSALQDSSVRWNNHAFSSFASLNALSPSALATATAGTGDACGRQPGGGGCWNMSAEESRWMAKPPKNTAAGGALTVKEVIAIKKGALSGRWMAMPLKNTAAGGALTVKEVIAIKKGALSGRWMAKSPKNTAGGGALTVKEVIAIKKGALRLGFLRSAHGKAQPDHDDPFLSTALNRSVVSSLCSCRIGLDFNGGSGSFAAHMARHNVTMMTSAMNLEANVGRKKGLPFLETIALRGLVPIWLPYKVSGWASLLHCKLHAAQHEVWERDVPLCRPTRWVGESVALHAACYTAQEANVGRKKGLPFLETIALRGLVPIWLPYKVGVSIAVEGAALRRGCPVNLEANVGRKKGMPLLEIIALRGLVPIWLPYKVRLPFYGNTIDIVHATNAIKFTLSPPCDLFHSHQVRLPFYDNTLDILHATNAIISASFPPTPPPLISLPSHQVRLPFYDNTLDILHATNAIKFMPSPAEFEEVLFEWDRVLRVGGVMWFEEFTASAAEMPSYLSVLDLLKYRHLHWSLTHFTFS
ncbi:unnamed protein product [Closterium sp. Naga37s-1]|nr:unnamed protein product [Closterium sp. Naga37s-1]